MIEANFADNGMKYQFVLFQETWISEPVFLAKHSKYPVLMEIVQILVPPKKTSVQELFLI